MHDAHAHATHTRTCNAHTHTTDRFIIACQESAGFTFQQNGPIWRANCCMHPSPPRTLRYLSPPPSRRASPLSRIHNGTEYMFLSQASRQPFFFLFSLTQAGEMGEERVILTVGITLCGS